MVIQIGLVLMTQIVFVVMTFKQHGQLSVGARVLQQMVAFVTNTFIGPMYATGLTLFYYDQRIRKEGYDIEWMMQAAGLTAPTADDVPSVLDGEPIEDPLLPPGPAEPGNVETPQSVVADHPEHA
jgi:hypothetical protein